VTRCVRIECSTKSGADPEELENIRRRPGAFNAFRFRAAGEIEVCVFESSELRATRDLASPFKKIRVSGGNTLANRWAEGGIFLPDLDDAFGLLDGEGAEEESIDNAEDSGISAEPEREDGNDGESEPGRFAEEPESESEIGHC